MEERSNKKWEERGAELCRSREEELLERDA